MAGLDAEPPGPMTFELDEEDGNVLVRIAGELDITNVEALEAAVAPALERKPRRLIIDANDLRFADSSAIALWVGWAKSVPDIELRNVSALLHRVVETMGLLETLHVKP